MTGSMVANCPTSKNFDYGGAGLNMPTAVNTLDSGWTHFPPTATTKTYACISAATRST